MQRYIIVFVFLLGAILLARSLTHSPAPTAPKFEPGPTKANPTGADTKTDTRSSQTTIANSNPSKPSVPAPQVQNIPNVPPELKTMTESAFKSYKSGLNSEAAAISKINELSLCIERAKVLSVDDIFKQGRSFDQETTQKIRELPIQAQTSCLRTGLTIGNRYPQLKPLINKQLFSKADRTAIQKLQTEIANELKRK